MRSVLDKMSATELLWKRRHEISPGKTYQIYRVVMEEDGTCLVVNDGQQRGEDGEQGEDDHQDNHQPRVCKDDIKLNSSMLPDDLCMCLVVPIE